MKHIPQPKQKLLLLGILTATVLTARALKLPCIYLHFLGVPCPGCGMTRAVFCALRLDLASAFSYHWMFWSVPVLIIMFLLDGKLFPKPLLNKLLLWLIGAGFAANWICSLFFR